MDNAICKKCGHNGGKIPKEAYQWLCSECGAINGKPFKYASQIKDSGDRTKFDTGAVRDMHTGKGRMDLIPWAAIMELSKHCENGAIKYGERNIDKGIPIGSLMDSAFRHMAKYMEGANDENHLVAALWNIAWALQFETVMPEMQNIPAREGK